MKVAYRNGFFRDVKKIKAKGVAQAVDAVIQRVKEAAGLQDISDCKKIAGSEDCFRIRVGEYRIGIVVEDDVVEFVRCLPRRDMCRHFPE